MSSINAEVTSVVLNVLNACVSPFAKYVKENYESIENISEEELRDEFRKLLDLTKSTTPTGGVSGLAPNLNGMASPKEASKRIRATKEKVDESKWYTVEEFKTKSDAGEKICAYCSNRVKPENKDKVCGGPAINGEETDCTKWRCESHKDKKTTEINKKMGKSQHGIDNSKNVPGMTIPSGIPPMISNLHGVNPIPPMPPLPSALMQSIGKKSSPPKLPPMPEVSKPLVVEEEPKKEIPVVTPPETIKLGSVPGLNSNQYICINDSIKNCLVSINQASGVYNTLGKLSTLSNPMPSDYMDTLIELSADEQSNAERLGAKYTPPVKPTVIQAINLPSLPSISGLNLPPLGN